MCVCNSVDMMQSSQQSVGSHAVDVGMSHAVSRTTFYKFYLFIVGVSGQTCLLCLHYHYGCGQQIKLISLHVGKPVGGR